MGADVTGPFKRAIVAAMHSDSSPAGVGVTVSITRCNTQTGKLRFDMILKVSFTAKLSKKLSSLIRSNTHIIDENASRC